MTANPLSGVNTPLVLEMNYDDQPLEFQSDSTIANKAFGKPACGYQGPTITLIARPASSLDSCQRRRNSRQAMPGIAGLSFGGQGRSLTPQPGIKSKLARMPPRPQPPVEASSTLQPDACGASMASEESPANPLPMPQAAFLENSANPKLVLGHPTVNRWGTFTGTQGLAEALPPASASCAIILQKIRDFVQERRRRIKDDFQNFDPLRSGRCSPGQFARCILTLLPTLTRAEVDQLVSFYSKQTGESAPLARNVLYYQFCKDLEDGTVTRGEAGACTPPPPHPLEAGEEEQLEGEEVSLFSTTTATAARRGAGAGRSKGPSGGVVPLIYSGRCFKSPADEALRLEQVLRRIALLAKTRGVRFEDCFQDAERSHSTSMLSPRNVGRITLAQFSKSFPFHNDFPQADFALLVRHYSAEDGDVCFAKLSRHIEKIILERPITDLRQASSRSYRMKPPTDAGCLAGVMGGTCRTNNATDPHEAAEAASTTPDDAFADLHLNDANEALEVDYYDPGNTYAAACAAPAESAALGQPQHPPLTARNPRSTTPLRAFPPGCRTVFPEPRPWGTSRAPAAPRALQLEDVLQRLALIIRRRRVPLHGAFEAFDPLRRGVCTHSQARSILGTLGMGVSNAEMDVLVQSFCSDRCSTELEYRQLVAHLCAAVDQVSTTGGKVVEAKQVQSARAAVQPAASTQIHRSDSSLQEVLMRISKQLRMRQVPIVAAFRDFDNPRTNRVTRLQFLRVLSMISCQLSDTHKNMLLAAYRDPENEDEGQNARIMYADFCEDLNNCEVTHNPTGFTNLARSAHKRPRTIPSKYYDFDGLIQPSPRTGRGLLQPLAAYQH
mmetsp:Transcript_18452/g.39459  ORF Transcript_18452/g.39459 Transcript_18452/m.39459 type:complete len:839 (-) Transcript_18452:384-2900(-)|eukprot:CAMPEP_0206424444 /NCGR_PEP_ID=MMETSP0324_2-20121206/3232_1 /ASSEMBLY_ACC=CAM_ASM_000836 /TAXON_ID=2866 /ORGANISM="Crypthecodinium cohnii, Strain Seligo" /LENGTH=838 /DNA_ID=CAMNT_0053889101 /DNA_START=108 /DNA_END=2624 /DNA_ORIENTATION=+